MILYITDDKDGGDYYSLTRAGQPRTLGRRQLRTIDASSPVVAAPVVVPPPQHSSDNDSGIHPGSSSSADQAAKGRQHGSDGNGM